MLQQLPLLYSSQHRMQMESQPSCSEYHFQLGLGGQFSTLRLLFSTLLVHTPHLDLQLS
jgi:hypothetical protein